MPELNVRNRTLFHGDNLTLLCPPCNRPKLDRLTLTRL